MLKTGLIAALPVEVNCLQRHIEQLQTPVSINDELSLIICGMGRKNATRGAEMLAECGMQRLISWGLAGALSENCHLGDLILPTMVHTTDKQWPTNRVWREQWHGQLITGTCQVHAGVLTDCPALLTTPQQKLHMGKKTGAYAADMESAAIATVAAACGLDFIVIRAISDDLYTPLPSCVQEYSDAFGRPIWPGFFLSICQHPAQIYSLWKLWRGLRAAQSGLHYAAQQLLQITT